MLIKNTFIYVQILYRYIMNNKKKSFYLGIRVDIVSCYSFKRFTDNLIDDASNMKVK